MNLKRVNWKRKAIFLSQELVAARDENTTEITQLRGDLKERSAYHEREISRLKAERDMWKVQAVALGKALHIVLRDTGQTND